MTCELLTQREGDALVLTLSGPATRNTLSSQVLDAAVEAVNVAESDASVRSLIFTGAAGHFCAGGDLRALSQSTRTGASESDIAGGMVDRFHVLVEAMRAFPKPIIAAVEGHAAGGGFSLALACDLLIAAEDARFHMSYARVGLSPDGGGSWQLMQMLPRPLALQLLWLGDPVSAAELQRWGLVNEVTRPGHALSAALRWSERLAERAPRALGSIKELVNAWPLRDLPSHLRQERAHFIDNLAQPQAQAALRAFFEARAQKKN